MCFSAINVVLAGLMLVPYPGLAQDSNLRADRLKLSLSVVWEKAILYKIRIQMQDFLLRTGEEEVKAAKAEKLPEINLPRTENCNLWK
jgi:hypothetical protein